MNDGIYTLDAARYYADKVTDEPTLNATVCKKLIQASPRHAWTAHPRLNPDYRAQTDRKFDVGSCAHEIFLLGNRSQVAVVDAKDWKTKAAQKERDDARSAGLTPLLIAEVERVDAMLAALDQQLPGLLVDPPMFQAGKPEQTIIWTEEKHGVRCRARLDYLHDDHSTCDDLKTTRASAHPKDWASRTLFGMQAEIQAVLTMRGVRALTGRTPEFRFLAVESHPPYGISPVRLGPSAIAMADHQIDRALTRWRECLDTGEWPAYPPVIVDAEPPSWHESDMWASEALDEAAA